MYLVTTHSIFEVFLGASFGHQKNFSDAFGEHVDEEIKILLEGQYQRIKAVLTEHKDGLIRVATTLMEKEHMTGAEFESVYRGESQAEAIDA